MSLTDIKVRNVKPTGKIQKLFDERGLFLLVSPTGFKSWRYKYRFKNKEKLLALGTYPDVGLSEAREKHAEARKRLKDGIDPSEYRKVMKAHKAEQQANSFEMIAREWFVTRSPNWAVSNSSKIIRRLELNIFPWLGNTPISEITPPMLLRVLRQVEERGALETTHRILSYCSQIFCYAIASGRSDRDPAHGLKGALSPKPNKKHFAAPTDPKQLGELLRVIEGYHGSPIVRCALKLNPLIFVRPGELRTAKWADIDFDKAEWRFTVSKTNTQHIVPLAQQSIALLQEIQPLTRESSFVFPSERSYQRPMSENAVLGALRRLGISKEEATGHGFRATARTLLEEALGFRADLIEHQLAHAVRDPNGRAYNRTVFLDERKKMMQTWANYLDELKRG